MTCTADGNQFAAWLKKKRLAADHRIPYFVRWVERFRWFRVTRPAESWENTLRVFLGDLDDARVPDWQIRQATDAASAGKPLFRTVFGDRGTA